MKVARIFDLDFDHTKIFLFHCEENFCSSSGLRGERFQSEAANICDESSSFAHESRFATFAAVWFRREVGSIGLDHDSIQRDRSCGLAHVGGALESHDSGEGHEVAEFDYFARLGQGSAEAMHYGTHAGRIGAEN